jgi:hypothetical protein
MFSPTTIIPTSPTPTITITPTLGPTSVPTATPVPVLDIFIFDNSVRKFLLGVH